MSKQHQNASTETSPSSDLSVNDKQKKSLENVKPIESTIAGGIAGLLSRLVIAPLDVVKIRLQLDTNKALKSGGNRRILDKLISIARDEGYTALFKGNVPAEIMYIGYGVLQFNTYRWTCKFIDDISATSSPKTITLPFTSLKIHLPKAKLNDSTKSFIAGSSSACVATTLTYPFDLLRTRFAIQATPGNPKVYKSLFRAFSQIYQNEGFTGFYRGLTPAIVAMIPYMGVFFASYQQIKNVLYYINPITKPFPEANGSANDSSSTLYSSKKSGSSSSSSIEEDGDIGSRLKRSVIQWLSTSNEGIAGLLAGIFAKTLLFPLDVIRKRLQVQGPTRNQYLSGTIPKYPRNPILTAVMIIQNEGILGLYKGLFISIIKSAPASAVTMWTYENSLNLMRYLNKKGYILY